MKFFTTLFKERYNVVLLGLGFILIVLAFFQIVDLTKFKLTAGDDPNYYLLGIGSFLVMSSLVITVIIESDIIETSKEIKVKKNNEGLYTIHFENSQITTSYGKIQDCPASEDSIVVLPANEFFDDDCINDKKSALGSFVQTHFENRVEELKGCILKELELKNTESVEKEAGCFQKSYGIGTCVFLNKPLKSKYKLVLASVTQKRAGTGLFSNISFIMSAIKQIHLIAYDQRINKVYTPILGSGHGGLRSKVALFTLLLGFSEFLSQKSGKEVNVIIYRNDDSDSGEIKKKVVKRIANYTAGLVS